MPSHNTKDRTGEIHEYWTIVSYSHTLNKLRYYLCRCRCGVERVKPVKSVVNGRSKSCGCLNTRNHVIHGKRGTQVYRIWKSMKSRCLNPKATKWAYYGGRGITVCDEWVNTFQSFYNDMGDPPTGKHSIDRINNDLGYFKENCRWATKSEQALNRRKPLPAPPASLNQQTEKS